WCSKHPPAFFLPESRCERPCGPIEPRVHVGYSISLPARARHVEGIRKTKDYGTSRGHSGFAPENLTTLPHLSIASATSFPKSAGEPGMTVPPSSGRRALTAASAKPAFISVLSLLIMWLGVFLGAAMPYHALAS